MRKPMFCRVPVKLIQLELVECRGHGLVIAQDKDGWFMFNNHSLFTFGILPTDNVFTSIEELGQAVNQEFKAKWEKELTSGS